MCLDLFPHHEIDVDLLQVVLFSFVVKISSIFFIGCKMKEHTKIKSETLTQGQGTVVNGSCENINSLMFFIHSFKLRMLVLLVMLIYDDSEKIFFGILKPPFTLNWEWFYNFNIYMRSQFFTMFVRKHLF